MTFKIFRKPIVIGKKYSIADLNTSRNALSSIDIKSRIPILIIDDEDFVYKEDLRDEKYNVTCVKNIEDLNAVEAYPIVICDIKGVGTQFDEEKEGAFVVRELKKKYPFKQLAVYSGSDYKLELMSDLEGVVTIKKGAKLDMWRPYCDELIRRASDPKENWKTLRDYLLKKDVPIEEVMKLESNYVDIYNHRPKDMKLFPEEDLFPNLSQDIRGVVQSMIAGGLLYLMGL